jgi:hypothetical protein
MKHTLPLVLLLACGSALAAPIYRCGKTYSQTPCPDGGTVVEATDPRSAAQRAEARRIAAAERKAAADAERARQEKDKAATPAPASLGAPAPAASVPVAAKKATKAKPSTDKDFTAVAPRDKPAGK